MEYVEFLRIRKALIWHVGILALVVLFVVTLGGNGATVNVNGSTTFASGMGIPIGVIASLAAFFGAIFASSAGVSLNRENATRELSWTKPLSRTLLALRFTLIDLAGVGIAYLIAITAIAIVLLRMHLTPYLDASVVPQFVLGFGAAAMWYGLILLVTSMLPSGGRSLSGIMWPVMLAIGALTQVPGITGAIARLLNIINPLAYMSNSSSTSHGVSLMQQPVEVRALLVWLFTAAFCAITIALWPRKEV